MTATQDAFADRLPSVHENAFLLYNRTKENIEYGREKLKDIVVKQAEEEAKEQQQQDDEEYYTVPKIKLVHDGTHIK